MQRRSSGSDDAADSNSPLPVNVNLNAASASLSLALGPGPAFDASATAQATSAQAYNPSITSDSRRTSFDHRSQSARSRRSGNFSSWKQPITHNNGYVEKAPLALAVDYPAMPTMTSKTDEDSDDVDKVPDAKGVLRRPRSKNPWAVGLLTLLVSLAGLAFLTTILNSSATRCLDAKGCTMSYMRPSYFKMSDFDTEHTRFGGKYSLYLYREQGVDDDHEIKVRCLHGCS